MKAFFIFSSLLLSISCLSEDTVPPAPHKDSAVGSGRSEAEGVSDPREKKGADRFFKSFESLDGEKSENPSFDVGFPGEENGEIHRCGATVVQDSKKESDSCVAMTAAHCVEPSFNKTVKVKTGYGEISAKVLPHPEYEEAHKNSTSQVEIKADGSKNIKTSEKPFDIAALEISDKDFCKKVAKVPSCSESKESSQSEPSKDEKLFMGSSWMGKLMSGKVAPQALQSVHGDTLETVIEEGVSFSPYGETGGKQKAAITQGDSGSGLFKKEKKKGAKEALCFLGVLSATGNKIPADPPLPPDFKKDAMYTAGKKVNQFIKQFAKKGK